MIAGNERTLPTDAGAWGTLVATAERLAGLFNDAIPLQVLRRGEAHGAEGYAELLEAPGVDDALHAELAALRSRCNRHVEILDDLIAKVPERPTRPMLGREVPDEEITPDPLQR